MPSPKDGTVCTLADPQPPKHAAAAADAQPGGGGTSPPGPPGPPKPPPGPPGPPLPPSPPGPPPGPPTPTHWISFELKDKKTGAPCRHEHYEVTLPDGSKRSGTLDKDGKAKITGIPAGECEINFPKIDGREWQES